MAEDRTFPVRNGFHRKMLSLRQLTCFVAVAEAESVAEAAPLVGMSASPLSRQIQTLESRLGLQLFERSRKRLKLTEAGRAFLAQARALLAYAARTEADGRALGRQEVGRLTIGYVEGAVHTGVLPNAIRRVKKRYPTIEIQLRCLRSGQQLAALREREIDCAFVHNLPPEGDDELVTAAVSEDTLLLAVPTTDALAKCAAIRPAQLDRRIWITHSIAANADAHQRFVDACAAAGFLPDVRFEADNLLTLLGLVGAGLGIAMVQASLRRVPSPEVVLKSIPWFPFRVPIHVVRRRADQRSAIQLLFA